MSMEISYTIEEVAKLLKVSKLTIYDLVKKGEIPVFRIGRQMRMHANDLEYYINSHKSAAAGPMPPLDSRNGEQEDARTIIISGQDLVLDLLGNHIEQQSEYKTLRSYASSMNSLLSIYRGETDIVSLHMFDGDTGEYNVPYIRKFLVSYPCILINLVSRKAGLYVQKGNPLKLNDWNDLNRQGLTLINREKGSGARILLEEQLRLHRILPSSISGYENEGTTHYSVASAISSGQADVGIGIEKAAKMANIDFIPLITERYDLVLLKSAKTSHLIHTLCNILQGSFKAEIEALGDYDVTDTGKVLYETF